MSRPQKIAAAVLANRRPVVVTLLAVTLLLGSGAFLVSGSASLADYRSDDPAVETMTAVQEEFSPTGESTAEVLVVVEDEDVLDRESLVGSLAFQESLRSNETVDRSLPETDATLGIANAVATAAIRAERLDPIQKRAQELERDYEAFEDDRETFEEQLTPLEEGLEEIARLQREYERLNRSHDRSRVDDQTYEERAATLDARMEAAETNVTARLDDEQADRFSALADDLRAVERRGVSLAVAHEHGELDDRTYQRQREQLREQRAELFEDGPRNVHYEQAREVESRAIQLEERRRALEADRDEALSADPSLAEQRRALENLNDTEVEALVKELLGENDHGRQDALLGLLPASYEPGEPSTERRLLVVRTTTDDTGTAAIETQETIAALADQTQTTADRGETYRVVGNGIAAGEVERAIGDSLHLVGPVAALLVVGALLATYRDPLDVAVSLLGVGAVLAWTVGAMGWLGISFTPAFVAVPALLAGLSVDYSIHVLLRYRERRSQANGGDPDPPPSAMRTALGGVGIAFGWITAATAVGFAANLASPAPAIRTFGLVTAFGIVSAFVVFGALVPALRIELASLRSARSARPRPIGTTGYSGCALAGCTRLARKLPALVLVVALVTAVVGASAVAGIEADVDRESLLGEQPPGADLLPSAVSPSEYTAADDTERVERDFVVGNDEVDLLIEGDVTSDVAVRRVAAVESGDDPRIARLQDDQPATEGPMTVLQRVAATNATVEERLEAADTTGDGIPDENVTAVYDAIYGASPTEARTVVARDDEEYTAIRVSVAVTDDADAAAYADELATEIDDEPTLQATATGPSVVTATLERDLLVSAGWSFLLALAGIVIILVVGARYRHDSAVLGALAVLPVVVAVAWLFGGMAVAGLRINALTGTIAAITVGVGVAFGTHLVERYALERTRDTDDPLETALAGTGGALLASANTTVLGFGALALATIPALRTFGIVTALGIACAFVATVTVLPAALTLWERHVPRTG